MLSSDAGWSSLVARRAHNPKVAGSNPAPATKENPGIAWVFASGAPINLTSDASTRETWNYRLWNYRLWNYRLWNY
jgi:hypothetical protein